jgi:hypothetical protein
MNNSKHPLPYLAVIETRELGNINCWKECKLVQPLWETVWHLLTKLKIELLYDPAIPLLGTYVRECTCIGIYTPMFIAALFIFCSMEKAKKPQ